MLKLEDYRDGAAGWFIIMAYREMRVRPTISPNYLTSYHRVKYHDYETDEGDDFHKWNSTTISLYQIDQLFGWCMSDIRDNTNVQCTGYLQIHNNV